MSKKYKRIGFSYYSPIMVEKSEYVTGHKSDEGLKNRKGWNLKNILEILIEKSEIQTVMEIDGDKIEIEPNSISKNNDLYFFQLTKLRVDNIPSKKKIGKIRDEIMLTDDEYIGEFTGIIYDSTAGVIMIQNNKYGPSLSEIRKYFNELRELYFCIQKKETDELMVDLDIVIDKTQISNIEKSKEIRKIKLRGNNVHLAGIHSEDESDFGKINGILGKYGDVNFEITISAAISKTNKTMDLESAVSLIKDYKRNYFEKKSTLGLEVVRKEEEDSKVEAIDFLLPKLTSFKSVVLEPRKAIGVLYLRDIMFDVYEEKRKYILKYKAKV